ncbi:uncharacterized protein, partial [Triticum aestivum]|uniref:uncharacterized protein n=1 Tax=Triticum aestivum TaxID=4565 RepID=UPI001D03213A
MLRWRVPLPRGGRCWWWLRHGARLPACSDAAQTLPEPPQIVDAAVEPNLVSRTNDGWSDLIKRYEGINHGEYLKLLADITTLRHERDHLEASVRRQTGEDLPSGATAAELRGLEHKLECALGKVRETKVCV